jgi:hypothetical protein
VKTVLKIGCGLMLLPIVAVFAFITSPIWVPLLWFGFKIAVLLLVVKFCYDILTSITAGFGRG